jgi:hypothetical protein
VPEIEVEDMGSDMYVPGSYILLRSIPNTQGQPDLAVTYEGMTKPNAIMTLSLAASALGDELSPDELRELESILEQQMGDED